MPPDDAARTQRATRETQHQLDDCWAGAGRMDDTGRPHTQEGTCWKHEANFESRSRGQETLLGQSTASALVMMQNRVMQRARSAMARRK
ncbi:hypothetical protein VTN96DRAFT_7307 [Rasamsonia emersonii]